ncbi:hypothetical protein JKF63_00744 [Porcisia hertigi]|uniref:Cytochrome b5 heme-binding domain-containing protein n=1 Tax=Porcisia hertigi TaxID=2761500 RepID=A0A836HZM2_9TRYP|nr:hypothetical protein JKF63_00744 [Porcisia hertigi]
MVAYTRDEVAAHCTPKDYWTIVDGYVYHFDIDFITTLHPGGLSIVEAAGKDGSLMFHENHDFEKVKPLLDKYCIGELRE